MRALFETSVFGSGVGWANKEAVMRRLSAMNDFMARMLATRTGRLQTSSFPNSVWECRCFGNSVATDAKQSFEDKCVSQTEFGNEGSG
jgi:hypothetical protein